MGGRLSAEKIRGGRSPVMIVTLDALGTLYRFKGILHLFSFYIWPQALTLSIQRTSLRSVPQGCTSMRSEVQLLRPRIRKFLQTRL